MDFGDKVRYLRELRCLSTTELAKQSDLSQSFISDIENKRRKTPTTKTIEKLAKGLGVPASYFINDDIVTPFELLPNVPEDLKEFMLKEESIPYLKISQKAKQEGISEEMLDGLLSTLILAMKKKNS